MECCQPDVPALPAQGGLRDLLRADVPVGAGVTCTSEAVGGRDIGRMIKSGDLAPAVLGRVRLQRRPPAVSVKDLTAVADLPWAEQVAAAFGLPVDKA